MGKIESKMPENASFFSQRAEDPEEIKRRILSWLRFSGKDIKERAINEDNLIDLDFKHLGSICDEILAHLNSICNRQAELEEDEITELAFAVNLLSSVTFQIIFKHFEQSVSYFWLSSSVGQNLEIKWKPQQSQSPFKIYVHKKDFIGSLNQLPVIVRCFHIFGNLICKATTGYPALYRSVSPAKWNTAASCATKNLRLSLLEFGLLLFEIEEGLRKQEKREENYFLFFVRNYSHHENFIRSLLITAFDYNPNGLIPYSGHYRQKDMQFKIAALCANFALFCLIPREKSVVSWKCEFMKIFMQTHSIYTSSFLKDFFYDAKESEHLFSKIFKTMNSFYLSITSLLKSSTLSSPFIEEAMLALLLLSMNKSTEEIISLNRQSFSLMPLIVIGDNIAEGDEDLQFVFLSLSLSLTRCFLTSRRFLHHYERTCPLQLHFQHDSCFRGKTNGRIDCFLHRMFEKLC